MSPDLPLILLTGVDADAMASAAIGLQWDLPSAVSVHHRIDVEAARAVRTISDATGILEREDIDLEHVCVSCTIREDLIPTLERLSDIGRWSSVLAHLPVSAEGAQVCRVLTSASHLDLRVAAVIAAVDGPSLVPTLTSDDLLCEVGRHAARTDRRGQAETAAAMLEYADVISVHGDVSDEGLALSRALARPGARLSCDWKDLSAAELAAGIHDHAACEAWAREIRTEELPHLTEPGVWRLDLRADRPFHPERLHERIAALGSGAHRSRGCFSLASRPGEVCVWDGAGGQVSVGGLGRRAEPAPAVRLVVTGLDSLTPSAERAAVQEAFAEALVTDAEWQSMAQTRIRTDGFEAWLGPVTSPNA